MDRQLDRAAVQRLLCNRVSVFSSFKHGLFDGIHLNQPIEMRLLAPVTFVVVVVHGTRGRVANDGESPTRKMDAVARRFGTKQFDGLLCWFF